MESKFLVHTKSDYVGVATQDIEKGETAGGVFMDNNEKISLKAMENIPLGHKIALKDVKNTDKVIEYGEPIGKAIMNIKKGEHVHTHNLRSLRW